MSRLMLLSCFLLTVVAVFIAARIEYLNVHAGYLLPRHPSNIELPAWVVPSDDAAQNFIDTRIYEQREQMAFHLASMDPAAPVPEPTFGPPYSSNEQRFVNVLQHQFTMHAKLHWWVSNFGMAQYALAPLALVVAVSCLVCLASIWIKSAATCCALLNAGCVLLMYTRGYWHALGVES